MKTAHWIVAAVASLTLNIWVGNAQAAPVSADVNSVLGEMSNVEKAHVRCWWHRGHRHCRRYVRAYRYYDDAPYYYGQSYYGYGPGIGLFFGGGHHHHHGFHGHGHHHHR